MRKLIAAINMTIDGFCDHTAGLPNEEIHQHYTELLGQADAILYGRTTYPLMEFWRTLLENPSKLEVLASSKKMKLPVITTPEELLF